MPAIIVERMRLLILEKALSYFGAALLAAAIVPGMAGLHATVHAIRDAG
jgi:hypothetical protein